MAELLLDAVDAPNPRVLEGAVVLDWWVSLQCPDSAASSDIVGSVVHEFGSSVLVRVRHFPLPQHIWAVAAAQAQLEAVQHGLGLEFARAALEIAGSVRGPEDYLAVAQRVGVAPASITAAWLDGRHAGTVRDDVDSGRSLGVAGTPSFCLDGLLIGAGKTLDGVRDLLASRLGRT